MKKKLMYETPDVEVIELRLDGYILQDSLTYGENGAAGGEVEEGNTYNL